MLIKKIYKEIIKFITFKPVYHTMITLFIGIMGLAAGNGEAILIQHYLIIVGMYTLFSGFSSCIDEYNSKK